MWYSDEMTHVQMLLVFQLQDYYIDFWDSSINNSKATKNIGAL